VRESRELARRSRLAFISPNLTALRNEVDELSSDA
jgi:hypothetical protein